MKKMSVCCAKKKGFIWQSFRSDAKLLRSTFKWCYMQNPVILNSVMERFVYIMNSVYKNPILPAYYLLQYQIKYHRWGTEVCYFLVGLKDCVSDSSFKGTLKTLSPLFHLNPRNLLVLAHLIWLCMILACVKQILPQLDRMISLIDS